MDGGKTKAVGKGVRNKLKCQNYTRDSAFEASTYKIEF